MWYQQRRPGAPLDVFVESVWVCRLDARPRALERVLPLGAPQLIINLAENETRTYRECARGLQCVSQPASILTGVTTRAQVIDTDEQAYVAGVCFRPGGTVAFSGMPANELSDVDMPLDMLWAPSRVERLRSDLLEAPTPAAILDVIEVALREMWRDRGLHPAVAFALSAFRARPSVGRVADVTAAIGLSPKRFIERFRAEVGVTPKRYCRLLRFQHAVATAHGCAEVDWAGLALACGYADQAHLIHEFREFSGLTPTRYEAGRTAFQNHVTFLQLSAG